MNRLVESFRSLPRSARWLITAAAGFVVYFLVIEPLLDRTNAYDAQADAVESNLRRAASLSDENSEDGRIVANGMRTFGLPHLPDAAAARPEAIQRVVDRILEDHAVTSRTKTERNATLTGDRARELAGDARIERYVIEVSFEASQEAVAAIVADLERAPGVSAVSRVKIDRTAVRGTFVDDFGLANSPVGGSGADGNGGGRVRATISAEAWVLIRPKAGSSTGELSS